MQARPSPLRRAFLTITIALVACACGGQTTTPPKPVASPTPSAQPIEAPTKAAPEAEGPKTAPADEPSTMAKAPPLAAPVVKLLDAGSAPRRALRYTFKAGVSDFCEMDMKMAMTMAMRGHAAPRMDLPTVRITLRMDTKEVTPEGDARITFNAEKVTVLQDSAMDPAMRASLVKEMNGLVGMRGKTRISVRGVATESELDLAAGAPPTLKSQLESMKDSLRQMYVPLPEEEVGKGARWDVTSRVDSSGALMDVKVRFTLTKLDASSVEANTETTLAAPSNQPMKLPTLPPGATATLSSLSGTGTGKIAPSFTHLVGSATTRFSTETAIDIAMESEHVETKVLMEIALVVRPIKTPAKK